MAQERKHLLAFNRGVISKLGASRIDLDRHGMSAEIQKNFIPRVLGSMMLRPGTEFIDFMLEDLDLVRQMPFIFSVDDTALLEMNSDGFMRIRIDDVVLTRAAHSSIILNPTFAGNITSWTDTSTGAATVTYDAGSGDALFQSDGTDFAQLSQSLNVSVPDQSVEHALDIDCDKHLSVRVGTALGLSDILADQQLGAGEHHIAFTPGTSPIFITLRADRDYDVFCQKCDFDATGEVQMLHPWSSELKLRALRWAQSGDVIYVASENDLLGSGVATRQKKIVRYGTRSWAIMDYDPEDGPFRVQNVSAATLTPSALSGDITLTASVGSNVFDPGHINFGPGALFYIDSQGQTVQEDLNVLNEATDPIRVTGTAGSRIFTISITGTWVGTIQLQFATDENGPWTEITSYTTNQSTTYDDEQDGAILYYRLQMTVATSGSADAQLIYSSGSIRGIARITAVTSAVLASARVLKHFGNTDASADWGEGEWSTFRGYPDGVQIYEGRLWWAGQDRIYSSVSDSFEEFDPLFVGDAGPINRTLGFGPIRRVNWMLALQRLMLGVADMSADVDAIRVDGNSPLGIRSNSFDQPLTPTNFNVKSVASKGLFVDRTKQRLYELAYDGNIDDYSPLDLSIFTPDFNEVGIQQIAVQMKPDVRVHCVREDGTVGMLVYDRNEGVIAWIDVEMGGYAGQDANGHVWDVAVLPGTVEDQVYYTVQRNNSATSGSHQGEERTLEKWALESEAIGGDPNKMLDSMVVYSGAPISSFTVGDHLAGQTIGIWADGADRGTVVVGFSGGAQGVADLSGLEDAPYSDIVGGMIYTGQFKSTKLASVTGNVNTGTAGIGLHQRKKIDRIGLVLRHAHYQGLQYGPTFSLLNDMPAVEEGDVTADDTIWTDYDQDNFAFGGDWDPDSRICLQCVAPRPCTVLSAVINMETLEFD